MSPTPLQAFSGVAKANANQHTHKRTIVDGEKMTGAQALVRSLEDLGVKVVFGIPGGAILPVYDAIDEHTKFRFVLMRHEQAAGHAAEGYAVATGEVGVCIVTSGPGATNVITAIADANMDSIPMIVVTGQVGVNAIGTDAFQEADIVGATYPVAKHSYLVTDAQDIPRVLSEAHYIARSGRPGPVVVDLTKTAQNGTMYYSWPQRMILPGYNPTTEAHGRVLDDAARLFQHAFRPVLYVGGGAVRSDAGAEVKALSDLTGAPIVTTLPARGIVPDDDPAVLGMLGMHGTIAATGAVQRSDLLVAIGARFDDRVTGKLEAFAPGARVIHIDIDPAEIGKVREVQVPIVGDLKGVLAGIVSTLEKEGARPGTGTWVEQISAWRTRYPFYHPGVGDDPDEIVPEVVLKKLSESLDPQNSVVVTEVGQHQMWAAQSVDREAPRSFLSSGGLGTMGFGFPAAIGAAIGCPEKQVVCVAGDGSFQMNSQEMATASIHRVPVKVLILDNRCLGMVHQWQKLFYDERYSSTLLDASPDFVKLAEAYGWRGERVEKPADVDAALARMLASDGPYLLDVAISRDQNVYPMVAPGRALDEVIGAIDVAVGAVRTDVPEGDEADGSDVEGSDR